MAEEVQLELKSPGLESFEKLSNTDISAIVQVDKMINKGSQ